MNESFIIYTENNKKQKKIQTKYIILKKHLYHIKEIIR